LVVLIPRDAGVVEDDGAGVVQVWRRGRRRRDAVVTAGR
jgi:hypothetical protein